MCKPKWISFLLKLHIFVLLNLFSVGIQAPIKVFGIEGRYAHALFSAAAKKKCLDKVEKELNDFQVLIQFCCRVQSR